MSFAQQAKPGTTPTIRAELENWADIGLGRARASMVPGQARAWSRAKMSPVWNPSMDP